MLVLNRNLEDEIVLDIPGTPVRVRVLSIRGGQVRLGIEAPAGVPVHRGEVQDWIRRGIHRQDRKRTREQL